ncbi:MAG: recombination mediator RecR [Bacteroidales bacterium]|nr:recombination mediator RecR [Bacteroidales bacterium]MCF8338580.1 recombination mediator RecR [Bacteroidales bacterium]
MENIPSKLVERAVDELSKLPGIGRRTAMRLALHMLKQDEKDIEVLGRSLIDMRSNITYCRKCHNISDSELCNICSDHKRDHTTVCIVEDVRDVMAIENTSQYNGLYHVLGGIISPMEGIGPEELTIEKLIQRVREEDIRELIMALPTTIEGDTTNFYIYKQIKDTDVKVSTIAKGVSFGNDLEYADEVTLGRSIVNRTPYEDTSSE